MTTMTTEEQKKIFSNNLNKYIGEGKVGKNAVFMRIPTIYL